MVDREAGARRDRGVAATIRGERRRVRGRDRRRRGDIDDDPTFRPPIKQGKSHLRFCFWK